MSSSCPHHLKSLINMVVMMPVHRPVDLANQRKVGCVRQDTHATADNVHQKRVCGSRGSLPCHSLKEYVCVLGSAAVMLQPLRKALLKAKFTCAENCT